MNEFSEFSGPAGLPQFYSLSKSQLRKLNIRIMFDLFLSHEKKYIVTHCSAGISAVL